VCFSDLAPTRKASRIVGTVAVGRDGKGAKGGDNPSIGSSPVKDGEGAWGKKRRGRERDGENRQAVVMKSPNLQRDWWGDNRATKKPGR